jgi:Helicase associated domain
MAQAYIKHELYKFDTPERWEAATDEFYNQRSMDEVVVKKSVFEVKKPFLSGLESRIKALPKTIQQHETDEQKLCREIKKLKEEVQEERIRKGEEDPENRKKRKRAGPETRGRPRISDIEMTPEMEQRFYAAQKVRDEEKKAADGVKDIERQIRELQKRLEVAKQEQKAAAERADKVSAEFSAEVIHGTGPWKDMFVQLQKYGEEHGTVNIIRGQSAEMKALRRWVLKQRERYHMNDDQRSKLPWYCAKNLEAIGFIWRYSDGTWIKFYQELVEYKKEHGDCKFPCCMFTYDNFSLVPMSHPLFSLRFLRLSILLCRL